MRENKSGEKTCVRKKRVVKTMRVKENVFMISESYCRHPFSFRLGVDFENSSKDGDK